MSILSLRKIKHDSSSVDNIITNTDGGVGLGGIDPSTLPGFIDHAVKVQNGGGLGIQSTNATDNRWIFFGHGTTPGDVQRAGIVNQGSDQSLALATAGTQRLIVDAIGRITTPYQPAFAVYNNSNQSFSSTGTQVVDMTNAIFNRGNAFNLSTDRFTAPISGLYHFSYAGMMMGQNTSTTFVNLSMRINGSIYSENMQQSFNKADYNTITGSYLVSLSANDTVDFVIYYANANAGSYLRAGSNMNTFMGCLLG
jgi:hypothetical protein